MRIVCLASDPDYLRDATARLAGAGLAQALAEVEGREALVQALDQGDVDLVLADHEILLDGDGSNLDLVRQYFRLLPFVVFGDLSEDNALDLLELGIADYVPRGDLARMVNSVFRCRRAALEKEMLRRSRLQESRVSRLNALALQVLSCSTVKEVLQVTGEAVLALLCCRYVHAGHGTDGRLSWAVHSGLDDNGHPPVPRAADILNRLRESSGSLRWHHGHAVSGKQVGAIPHPRSKEPAGDFAAAALSGLDGGEAGAVIAVEKIEGSFSRTDEALLKQVAAVASLAIRHIEARREAERQARALKREQRASRKLADQLALALKAGRSGTFDWDVKNGGGRWSDELLELYGLRREEFGERFEDWLECVIPEDRQTGSHAFRQAMETGEFGCEFRIRRRDNGELRWMYGRARFLKDGNGEAIRAVGINVDITERKEVEEQIRELNRVLEQRNAELNRERRELQKARQELEERVAERTVELADTVESLLQEITERTRAEQELQAETAERLRAIEALREKDRMLMQQSRQAAMGEMIGNIAHQWRQPLNALALMIQSLSVEKQLGELTEEYLLSIEQKSMKIIHHMSQTINDFRNYFKPDKEKAPFIVSSAVRSTVSFLEESFFCQDIEIRVHIDEDVVVDGYPNEYAQVLLNILNNARDAFLDREVPPPRIIEIRVAGREGRSVVTVVDNAGGISEAVLPKIFEPYFTTKEPDRGTGVGLFMSKSIVEKNMGGRLTARNVNGGAEFTIEV
ncbi:PAS domain-containing protein [Geomesophilobacter sediminis]|uniref:histidine kinase n=1 Tax=Geomesophilobacter sediminis TaxID=2798584 RepID=A0A8J7LVQ4_9BACT|nr:PAS domain-containing protein [Geomesophilobacter sediminis]MBJ6725275.1 PAS domain-containing protein [Geomesophilobacter sediminis]